MSHAHDPEGPNLYVLLGRIPNWQKRRLSDELVSDDLTHERPLAGKPSCVVKRPWCQPYDGVHRWPLWMWRILRAVHLQVRRSRFQQGRVVLEASESYVAILAECSANVMRLMAMVKVRSPRNLKPKPTDGTTVILFGDEPLFQSSNPMLCR